MGLVNRDDGWRVPDWLWERMQPLLPARPEHPLGCHNPRVPDREAMNAILLVLRTGMQWNALNATGICHSTRLKLRNAWRGDRAVRFGRRVGASRRSPPCPVAPVLRAAGAADALLAPSRVFS